MLKLPKTEGLTSNCSRVPVGVVTTGLETVDFARALNELAVGVANEDVEVTRGCELGVPKIELPVALVGVPNVKLVGGSLVFSNRSFR